MVNISSFNWNIYLNSQSKTWTKNLDSSGLQSLQAADSYSSLQKMANSSLQNLQEQQKQYRSEITDFTNSVASTSDSAKALSASLFAAKYVSGSSGAVTGEAKSAAKTAQYDISISQLATAQTNASVSLASTGKRTVAAGISTLGIQVGSNAERQVSVDILSTDTNKQVLNKFASAINSSGADITAQVKTKNNEQYLSLTSKDTGSTNGFTIRDIKGNSGVTLQLSNKVQSATDAKYTVDGVAHQSSSNKVTIDNENVTLHLNKTTTKAATVDVSTDDSKIVAAAKTLVSNYNELNYIISNSDNVTKQGTRALNNIKSLVSKTRSWDFADIGISMNKTTGELQLNERKLATALDNNSDAVKNLLTSGGGLAKTIERASKDLASNSVNTYIKAPNMKDALNYISQSNSISLQSQYNDLFQGLFVNMMV